MSADFLSPIGQFLVAVETEWRSRGQEGFGLEGLGWLDGWLGGWFGEWWREGLWNTV